MNLSENSFFKDYIYANVTDALTGVINKTYITKYINYLIETKTKFSLSLVDVDNFKSINDNYGHNVGDMVLADIGRALLEYDSSTIVGRFGGDEFILIRPELNSYDESYQYIHNFFVSAKVFRRKIHLSENTIYVTATSGTAAYPKDASNYDELMLHVDQALYRGKVKGRNCYIVYVKEKHENINAQMTAKINIIDAFTKIDDCMKNARSFQSGVLEIFHYVKDTMDLEPMVIDVNNKVYSLQKSGFTLEKFTENGAFSSVMNTKRYAALYRLAEYDVLNASFREYAVSRNLHSALVSKVEYKNSLFGYLILLDSRNNRLWQENEIGIIHYIGKILGFELNSEPYFKK